MQRRNIRAARAWTIPAALAVLALGTQGIVPHSARAQGHTPAAASNVLYITTNDPTPGQNAVLAFRRGPDGALNFLGRYPMGGTGVGNPNFRLGTLDSDQSLIVSPDRRFLFAVNSGSDSIAVFGIHSDGTLETMKGSPFPSGGHFPAGVGLRGDFLYVAHKNEVPGEDPANFPAPNYTAFRVNPNGKLIPIPHSTVETPRGSSPTQTLISGDGRFVFSTELLADFPTDFFPADGFPAAPGAGGGNTLRSFVIEPNGRLRPNPAIRLPEPDTAHPDPLGLLSGSGHVSGTTNGALGLAVHPTLPILYIGFPFRFQLGVYTWDQATGALTFAHVVSNAGQVICWIQVRRDGRFAYTSNQLDSTVSVYDLNDPLRPVEIAFADLALAPGATVGGLASQESLTPDGRFLYVLEQRITDNAGDGSANALHLLAATPEGGVSEPLPPINLQSLGVPRTARPQGIAAF